MPAAEKDAERLRQDLSDPLFVCYVYVGDAKDDGWRVARAAYSLIPMVNIYLFSDHSLLKEWIDGKKPKGIMFGWKEQISELLDKAAAEDLELVVGAIHRAQSKA